MSTSAGPRTCRRPGCPGTAVATMSLAYADAHVVVEPLTPTPEPARWDLCVPHARDIAVPVGWTCEDRRATGDGPARARDLTTTRPSQPDGRPSSAQVSAPSPATARRPAPPRGAGSRPDRYAVLTAMLPQIAASARAAPAGSGGRGGAGGGPGAPADQPPADVPGQLRIPAVERVLAADDGCVEGPDDPWGALTVDDAATAETSGDVPSNVVPFLPRVLDPIG